MRFSPSFSFSPPLHFILQVTHPFLFRVLMCVVFAWFRVRVRISAPLSALLEVDRLSRPQVVKQLWIYIKEHELQNPSNKREILCDDRLRLVFNSDKIDMFKMNKVLGQCVVLPFHFLYMLTHFESGIIHVDGYLLSSLVRHLHEEE